MEGGFSVNNSPLLKASVSGINANFESNFINVDIGADLVFQDNEQTPTEVASLVRSVQSNKPMETAVKLRQFSIGYSDFDKVAFTYFHDNRFILFRKLTYQYQLMLF